KRVQNESAADQRRQHVGYYLIDDGRFALERDLHYPVSFGEHLTRGIRGHAALLYLGGVAVLTALFTGALAAILAAFDVNLAANVLVTALAILPTSELAIGVVNFLVTAILRPRQLPKLEFLERIPPA